MDITEKKMYSKKELEELVVFDIETVSGHKSLDDLSKSNERLADLWIKRCDYLRRKHSDNAELTDEQIYEEKAGLQAEYGKIVCITVGYIRFNKENLPIIKVKSYYGDDEKLLLTEFFNFLNQLEQKLPDSRLAGHNIKRFDIPYVCKRGLIHKIKIPNVINSSGKKPWEINHLDSAEVFAFGSWQESFTSLDVLSCLMGVPSPKSDIDGSQVGKVYWQEKDVKRIMEYCERDVISTANTIVSIAGLEIAIPENTISV